jgi:sialate O-acetylesterase
MNMTSHKWLLNTGLLCILLLFSVWASANIELPSFLSDGAIIQRDKPVPIWGKANPNSKISVTLGDTTKQVTSDADGDWAVVFDACVAGSTLVLTVTDGQQRLVVQDLLAGDIWVASGQSNMEWVLRNTIDADEEIHTANYPAIRHFKVQRTWAAQASDSLASGQWQPAGSAYVGEFSAVAYYFAKKIHL